MHLVIALPALNEEKTIEKVLHSIPIELKGISKITKVVVNDGSTDRTVELSKKAGAHVITHKQNMGVGAAFHSAVNFTLETGADILLTMDADGQFNSADIPTLIAPILAEKSDLVTASRFKDPEFYPTMTKVKFWGNQRIAALVSLLIGKKYYDVACGFRAYSREALLNLNLFGKFTYTQETFLDLAFKGLTIIEIPVKIRGIREFGKSRVASNVFKYAINTLKIMLRTFRDYSPLRLFGSMSLVLFIIGSIFASFLAIHYLQTGKFSPHIWSGFVAGFTYSLSAGTGVMALLADMIGRLRRNQERLLYYEKKRQFYGQKNA